MKCPYCGGEFRKVKDFFGDDIEKCKSCRNFFRFDDREPMWHSVDRWVPLWNLFVYDEEPE